jgi:hypothetical protein
MLARGLRVSLGTLALGAALEVMPGAAHALPAHPPSATAPQSFDWSLYESWSRTHHRRAIPLTRFAWQWMAHREMCGAAVTGETVNRRTLSIIQDFDRCWAVQTATASTLTFNPYS